MRRMLVLVAGMMLTIGMALPASAHAVVAPGHDGVWIGGGPVPGQGQALLGSPVGALPPSHAKGLVEACERTWDNPSVVVLPAPPYFTSCVHGQP
ncbi:MAG TPA: hypothetical protein VLB67_03420 [Acidimicrobiia bacterium]|nr:hypothetical protein [Acidimicrobiia bacterium]